MLVVEEGVVEEEGCGCCSWRFHRGEEEAVEEEGGRMTKAVWVWQRRRGEECE